jgi:glycerol-3-phosphate dehydrogenase
LESGVEFKTEVVIVGGGATGVGIARDLALRGIPSLLIEKGDLASGASGRNHGLLHSGGRYAVSDLEAARECIRENKILTKIAPHCIEATGGLFVSLPEDSLDFRDQFVNACERAGIETTVLSRDEALTLEPNLKPSLLGAVKVPDGSVDPFQLVMENSRDAENHGARLLLHTGVTSLIGDKKKVRGVKARDLLTGEEHSFQASYVVNATGAWASRFLRFANIRLPMALSKGTLLVTNHRVSRRVINRCRKPSDGDIIVPNHLVSILGTTSVRLEDVDNFEATPSEVDLLIRETSSMLPEIQETRFIRAYAGIRPLVQSELKEDDRTITRGFTLVDHGERDGVQNLMTITGGKFITYRLMAERTVDLLCQKMGTEIPCSTHLRPLPGSGEPSGLMERLRRFSVERGETLCDCELIQREEIERLLQEGKMKDLRDILHRTRLAKGTCQGGFCVYRLLGVLHEFGMEKGDANEILKSFLEERWKGIRPVLWGTSLREHELIETIYRGIFNL